MDLTILNEKKRQVIITLIAEELKSRKLAVLLSEIGVEDCQYLPMLNEPIAELLGLVSDESFERYDAIMNKQIEEANLGLIDFRGMA